MKMKMSNGAKIALGLGALVIIYLVVKNNQGAAAAAAPAPDLALPSVQPISNAGIVAIDVQPAMIPLQLQMN
jgi:hypothetical protein